MLGTYKKGHAISFLNHNGQTVSEVRDIANILGAKFSKISSNESYPPVFAAYKKKEERKALNFKTSTCKEYNAPFTVQELTAALNKTRPTSSGPDRIHCNMLKNLSEKSLNVILFLFNRIWTEQCFPALWCKAVVVPITKPGKDPHSPSHYRPIALTSCLCKLMERIVNTRLVYFLEETGHLSKFQSGFRCKRGTVDNALMLETAVRDAFVTKKHLVSIFFDMEKAYDRAWRYGILRELYKMGYRGNLPLFIKIFLGRRTFNVRVGDVLSYDFPQYEGVPQGSVLSVILFVIKVNEIVQQLPQYVHGSLYVDDFQIHCAGVNMSFIERQLQTAITAITNWCDKNGFVLSAQKTNCVHFCKLRGMHPHPEIFLNGTSIPMVSEAKFLGIILDEKLSFRPHILNLKRKCNETLNLLKILSNTTWGADFSSLLKIYKALVLSKLDYGCTIYGSARKSLLQTLDTIHHQGLRFSSGAFRTSSVQSLYIINKEPALELRRHKIALKMRSVIQTLNTQNVEIEPKEDGLPPWRGFNIRTIDEFYKLPKSLTSDNVYQQLFYYHRQQHKDFNSAFTDGSKTANHVGSAVVFNNFTVTEKLHEYCTVFTAEVYVILLALNVIGTSQDKKWIIYTDSKSSVEALLNVSNQSHPLLIKAFKKYLRLNEREFQIIFCWIPGHVGISGNE
ncbi:RNA-directed DNA polymerase from mobile element jockey [Araneus ventricosus]|uniref:RNA-directed DNA polymerase from mobile element jockey n=1 Tax=Araneus ventricosus TaxID=182803 RepID=A0A4Y2SSH0_ARAVE|nr:RNA-directed DNA polymerase from mobile element jockey [Araneus ventricosus]